MNTDEDTEERYDLLGPEMAAFELPRHFDADCLNDARRVVALVFALLQAGVSAEELLRRLHSPGQ